MSNQLTDQIESTDLTSDSGGGAAILLENVTKRYGNNKPAVDQLTLEIPAGKVVMFVGKSGCGKTTTLKLINRLIEPTEGRIFIGGEDASSMNGDKLRRNIGYVIQSVRGPITAPHGGGQHCHRAENAEVGQSPHC